MKKNVLKLGAMAAIFAVCAMGINFSVEAQGDPAGLCPDGQLRCAKQGTNVWHKGNTNPNEINMN